MMVHMSEIYRICVIITTNVCWSNAQTNMYLSTAHYETSLPKMHEESMNYIEALVKEEKKRLGYLKRFKMEHEMAKHDSSYLQNPLNAFIVFKRLTTDFKLIKELAHRQVGEDIANEFTDIINNEERGLPDKEDLYGAAMGLRRVQATYKLDVKDLAEGKIDYDGVTRSLPMLADDCYKMGDILHENGDFFGAKAWIEEAIRRERPEGDASEFYQSHLDEINKELNKNAMNDYEVWNNVTWEKQASLCRNDFEVPQYISKRFTCYLTRSSPFLQMAPVKTEQLYLDPDILLFHDVISDDEIEHLKQLTESVVSQSEKSLINLGHLKNTAEYRTCNHAWFEEDQSKVTERISRRISDITGFNLANMASEKLHIVNYGIGGHYDAHLDFFRLEPALVYNPKTGVSYAANSRTCKYAWLEDGTSEVTTRISHRITDVTGLSMERSVELQILNYGIGGHYDYHCDFIRKNFSEYEDTVNRRGNRMATVLFYISNVAQGGATVFLELGLTVFPKKNAALYWRNLHPSGEGNLATEHAACPVLRGSKWILTKWIRQHGQELLRPCNLEYQREEDVKKYPKSKKRKLRKPKENFI